MKKKNYNKIFFTEKTFFTEKDINKKSKKMYISFQKYIFT